MDSTWTQRNGGEGAVQRVRALWSRGEIGIEQALAALAGLPIQALADGLVADAEERWERGLRATLADYQKVAPEVVERAEVRRGLLMCEVVRRASEDAALVRGELLERHPDLAPDIESVMALAALMRGAEDTADVGGGPGVGDRLGKYTLVRVLGAGAFGEVWQARDEELGRYVALKLLFRGESQGARVVMEARAAAALQHENIVAVHDAGRLDEDGPWQGREYIDSQLVGDPAPTADDPINVAVGGSLEKGFGDGMPPRRRAVEAARLVAAIADGIAAAHARGVLHRDLKPANILVTPSGRPLVADFGLSISAHASDPTEGARVVGTPAYMAPEQARGEPCTPLTDVFALGAVLRFLLTGLPAYTPSGKFSPDPRTDVIAQAREEGVRPVGAAGVAIPRTLAAIADKALAYEPRDRYVSAEQMGADLRAWLGHRPAIARPRSRAGLVWLWYRRNVLAASIAAGALLIISAGTVRFISQMRFERDRAKAAEVEADKRRREAEHERDTTASINQFMQEMLYLTVASKPGERVTVDSMLGSAMRRVGPTLGDKPLIEAGVRHMLGVGLHGFGSLDPAQKQLERAVELRRAHLGPEAPDTLRSRVALARVVYQQRTGDLSEAELTALVPLCESALGPSAPDTLLAIRGLGRVHLLQRRVDRAAALLNLAAKRAEAAFGASDQRTFDAWSDLSALYAVQGDTEGTIVLSRRTVEGCVRAYGEDDSATLARRAAYGYMLRWNKQFTEAEVELRKAYEGLLRASGARNTSTIGAGMQLAELLTEDLGRAAEAVPIAEAVVAGVGEQIAVPLEFGPHIALAKAHWRAGDRPAAIQTATALFDRALKDKRGSMAAMASARLLRTLHTEAGDAAEAKRYNAYINEHAKAQDSPPGARPAPAPPATPGK